MADQVFELNSYSLSAVLEGCGDVVGELIKLSKKGAAWALENERDLVRQYPEAKLFTREELAEIYAVGNSLVGLAIIKNKPEVALLALMSEKGSSTNLILSIQKGYGSLGKEIVKRFGHGFDEDDLKAVMPHLSRVDPTVAQDIVAGFSKNTLTRFFLKNPDVLTEFTSGAFGAVIENVNLGSLDDGYHPKTLAQLLMESLLKSPNGFDSARFELMRKAIGSDASKIVSKALLVDIPSLLGLDLDTFANLIKKADLSVLKDEIYKRSLGRLLLEGIASDPNGVDFAKIEVVLDAARPILKQLTLEGSEHEQKFLTKLLLENVEVAEKILVRLDDRNKAEIMNSLASGRNPRFTPLYLLVIQDSWKDGRNHTRALGIVLPYMKPETIGMEIHPFSPFGFLMMNPLATAEAIGLMAKYTSADDLWKTANFKYYLAFAFLHNLAGGEKDSEGLTEEFEKGMLIIETNLEKLKSVHPEIPKSPSLNIAEDFEFKRNSMVAYYLERVDRSLAFRVEEILKRHGLKYMGLNYGKE